MDSFYFFSLFFIISIAIKEIKIDTPKSNTNELTVDENAPTAENTAEIPGLDIVVNNKNRYVGILLIPANITDAYAKKGIERDIMIIQSPK